MNILNYLRIFVKKLFQLDYKCLGKKRVPARPDLVPCTSQVCQRWFKAAWVTSPSQASVSTRGFSGVWSG